MTRRCAAAVLIGIAVMAAPAGAQQSAAPDFPGPPTSAPLALPRAADTGKPMTFDLPPPAVPAGPSGLRLNGAIQKNGAVELSAPLFKW
jgi:hypothetical protein